MQPLILLPYILSAMFFQTLQPELSVSEATGPVVHVMETGEHEVLPGVVRPSNQVALSSPFDTLLGELRVKEGQLVQEGQIVAILDDRVVRAALVLAEIQANRTAQVDQARAALNKAEDGLRRITTARELKAAAETELEDAESDRDIAAANLRNAQESQAEAKASLELARTRHEEHMIRAPFDGMVVRIHAKPGAMVSPGAPLIEIVSDGGLCVDLYLPVSIADSLQEGDFYSLAIEDPKPIVVAASVRYIEPRVDPVSRTMRVVFDLRNGKQPTRLYAGVLTRPAERLPLVDNQKIRATAAVDHQIESVVDE